MSNDEVKLISQHFSEYRQEDTALQEQKKENYGVIVSSKYLSARLQHLGSIGVGKNITRKKEENLFKRTTYPYQEARSQSPIKHYADFDIADEFMD